MRTFNFWGRVVTALILGFVGFLAADVVPLPEPVALNQSREAYFLLGALVGIIVYTRTVAWVITTSTRLTKLLVSRLAVEIINQFTHLASRGLPSLPFTGKIRTADSDLHSNIGGALILDTSSIIDARILDVVKTGFLSGIILLPNFVLTELQQVADSADDLKRSRGRRGFEVIEQLKKVEGVKVELWDKDLAGKTVDDKLLRMGKILKGKIVTCDFNLNRVASLSGVKVLNLNDLANCLKVMPIPGEQLKLKIIHPGKDKNQGVGYLIDGTMVVVKDGVSLIGQEIKVEVNKILQGPAGRMIFGKAV